MPALILHTFPSWFVGIAFAAIGIGALVPAAIMSIAAANLYTRNIHREFINKNPTDKQEAQMAKLVSLIVKFGALLFIVFAPTQYAIQLQLLGGIWIIQTLPSVMLGVYTRWFNDWALLVGWAVGTVAGTAMAFAANLSPTYTHHARRPHFPGYAAFYTVILNLVVTVVLTPVFNAMSGGAAPRPYSRRRLPGVKSPFPVSRRRTARCKLPISASRARAATRRGRRGRLGAARDRSRHLGWIGDLLGVGAERFRQPCRIRPSRRVRIQTPWRCWPRRPERRAASTAFTAPQPELSSTIDKIGNPYCCATAKTDVGLLK